MDIKEIGYNGVKWNELAQDRAQQWDFVVSIGTTANKEISQSGGDKILYQM